MRKIVLGIAGGLAAGAASPALAGGAYCSPDWRPENPALNCASQIAISPGNDTRVNLYLLMHDRAGNTGRGLAQPDTGWGATYGHNFLKWEDLRAAWLPVPMTDESSDPDSADYSYNGHFGTHCQTVETGKAAFLDAMNRNRRLKTSDKATLTGLRERLGEACKDGPASWAAPGEGGYFANIVPDTIGRDPANGYLAYLEASASFYSEQWARTTEYYSMVAQHSDDEWLKETATYMIARTALNQAIDSGIDRWGDLQADKVTTQIAADSHAAFLAYISAYPEGRYASSARGLVRKALWLKGDKQGLASVYSDLIMGTAPGDDAAARLVEELDYALDGSGSASAPSDPLLLAMHNLQRMRIWDRDEMPEEILTASEIAAQKDVFADHPELYGFLKANHAFYVAQDYRAVLELLPDAARAEQYTPLAFSRQHLRGLALHALNDRNEEGFWLDLIKGSDGVWQRQSVELALARLYEQRGKLDEVFAENSPITDTTIRRILLAQSADLATLKRVARDTSLGDGERSFALYTALLKQLQYGQFKSMLADLPLIESFADGEKDEYGHWDLFDRAVAPVKTFTTGTWSDGYACPDLTTTVRTLAANPNDIDGRLCMGDFIRLNGFDDFRIELDRFRPVESEGPAALGSKSYFEGKPLYRLDFYKSIIEDRRASDKQRAYALYRGVWCYGPSGNNSCGSDVPVETRAAWFRRLKRDYPDSQWAQDLEYYW